MLLTKQEIDALNLVQGAHNSCKRATTYDATIGDIMIEGKTWPEDRFILRPRGIVWLLSEEQFHLPANVTGLATLRTRWTHEGVLALNVGIVDPGWKSHVATAVVNFGKSDFEISKGDTFLRILFFRHDEVSGIDLASTISSTSYRNDIRGKTRLFSDTFLTMDTLYAEVAERVLSLPRWAFSIGLIAIGVAIFAAVAPVAWSAMTQDYTVPSRVDLLEKEVSSLKEQLVSMGSLQQKP